MAFLRGTVDRVEPPNEHGWAKIFVQAEGHDRPVRIDTNRQEQMREAVELRDAHAYINLEYDEKSKFDQQRNRTYVNRYWVRASRTGAPEGNGGQWGGPASSDPPAPPAPTFDTPTPSAEFNRQTHPRDAWRICLSVGTERALQTIPYLPVEQRTLTNQKDIALYWARFIYLTEPLAGTIAEPAAAPVGTPQGEEPPWPTDDDIPF